MSKRAQIELFELEVLCKNGKTSESNLLNLLNKMDTFHLIGLCHRSGILATHLHHFHFKDFWAERLTAMTIPNHSNFHFQSQKKLQDMDFIKAYHSYLLAISEDKPQEKIKLLLQSILLHSIHAMQYLSHLLLVDEKPTKQNNSFIIDNLMPLLEKESLYHGTPVYLLIAKIYYFLANQQRGLSQVKSEIALYLAIKNLYKSKFSLGDSAAAIHNAYFGEGLAMSNPYKIETIDEILSLIFSRTPFLDEPTQKRARNEAFYEMHQSSSQEQLAPAPVTPPPFRQLSTTYLKK